MASLAHDQEPDADPTWVATLAAYRAGAGAVQRLGSKFVDWSLPTDCPPWNAVALAGHLLTVARRHHRLLAAALAGQPAADLPTGPELDAVNAADLTALGVSAGSDRILAFDAITTRYAERLAEADPERPMGSWRGIGTLTVGEHARLAAGEWHLHAWDLAGALGWDYRPREPQLLLAAWTRLGARIEQGDPWEALLAVSGRRPAPEPRPFGP